MLGGGALRPRLEVRSGRAEMVAVIRDDLSDRLIHLTKGDTGEESFKTLSKILDDRTLIGGGGYIKGGFKCVCFSEAPISKIGYLLSNPPENVKYRPYGLMFRKMWIFKKGGRPVIYQPDQDFLRLPTDMQYRHVRFYISDRYSIDHSWEREWRICTKTLEFTPDDVTIIVPTRSVIDAMIEVHTNNIIENVKINNDHSKIIRFPWHYIVLEDLGVVVEDGI